MATANTTIVTPPGGLGTAAAAFPPGRDAGEVRARQQAAVLAFGRRANAQPGLTKLTQDAVALLAEVLQAELSGASQVGKDGATLSLRIVSSPLDTRPVKPAVHQTHLGADESMASYALAAAMPVVSGDFAVEDRFCDAFLSDLGVRAALAVPLQQDKEPFGTLGVYCRRPREFTADETQFAETIAYLLTAAIARVKADEAVQQERAFTKSLLEVVDSLVVVLDLEGKIANINQACLQITGFVFDQIQARPFVDVFAAPEDFYLFRGTFQKAIRERSSCKFKGSLLTEDGRPMQVAWSLQVPSDPEGKPQAILLSGLPCAQQGTEASPTSPGRDRKELRASPRRFFQYRQMIAPVVGDAMPSEADFLEVDCCDISAGGLSFYLNRVPDFDRLIVALGKPPALTHFAAQVVRYVEKVNRGEPQYLVGCRFLGRAPLG
jgi:PAS domain S-box-containing protein